MIPPQLWTLDTFCADILLPARAARLLAQLRGLPHDALASELADPRGLHRALYLGLTPPGHPEFAGNYRGSDHPALRHCRIAHAFSTREGTTDFAPPGAVGEHMQDYARLVRHVLTNARTPSPEVPALLAGAMIVLGKIHPFLDGNGHVQRLTFQAMAERAGYALPGWRVHPKPYGVDVDRLKAAGDVPALAAALGAYISS